MTTLTIPFLPNRYLRRGLLVALLLALAFIFTVRLARAEGSRDMFPDPPSGNRTNIEWRNSFYGGGLLYRRTLFKVFANQNEVIFLGSTAVGVTNGDVLVYNPGTVTGPIGNETIPGAANFSCLTQRAGSGIADQGQINSRAEELAGPDTVPAGGVAGGYTPCTYTAPVTGIYNVVFYGPVGNNSNAQGTVTGQVNLAAATNFDATQSTSVAGWDVTVRANLASNVNIEGRLFTYYIAAFTGGNGRYVNSTMFAVTGDGYRYQTELRGLDPNGFVLYGNQIGYFDADGVTPLLRDAYGNDNQLNVINGGVTIARPSFPLFFNTPADATITGLGIPLNPVAPTISNLSFTGTAGANNSFFNTGGTFNFTTNVASIYQLVISLDGVDFDPTNPLNRTLRGVIGAGAQAVAWNGLDNSGAPFPVGNNYQVRAEIRAGEYHFPLMDAENSINGGPAFTLLNPPGGCPPFTGGCSGAFYDDRGYRTSNGTIIGAVNVLLCGNNPPATSRSDPYTGFNSAANPSQRAFGAAGGGNTGAPCTGSFGDVKGLDLWTFFPSNVLLTPLNIINAAGTADLALTKDDGTATYTPGGTTTYTVTVTNNGPDNVIGAAVTDTLPAAITGATWTCVASAGSACGAAAGAGNINTTVDLLNGGTATFTVVANISAAATGLLTNTACVAAPAGVTDPTPGNNCGTDTDTPPGGSAADLALTKDDGTTTYTPGGSTIYTVTVTNNGPDNVAGAAVTDTLPAAITSATWTCAASAGSACGAAAGAGNINTTVDLLNGGTATFTVVGNISAGATGNLTNTACVAAPAGVTDPTPGNNCGTDTDTPPAGSTADLALTKDDGTTTYTPGGTTTYTVTAINNGPAAVTGATVTDTLPAAVTSATWTCLASAGSACGAAAGTGNINTTVNLLNGGTATFTVVANISATASGNLTNTACITAPAGITDSSSGNNCGTDTDTPPGGSSPTATPGPILVDPAVTKEASVDVARIGDAVTFTLTVTNPNAVPVTNVTVSDPLPAQVDFISVTTTFGSCAYNAGAHTVNCNLGMLAPLQVVTITIQTRVNDKARPPETLRNVTLVAGDKLDGSYSGRAEDSVIVIPDEIPVTGKGPGLRELLVIVALALLAASIPLAVWSWQRRRNA